MGIEDYPLLQGQYLSWAEIRPVMSIFGGLDVKTKDFQAFDFNDSLSPTKVRGVGPGFRGRTVGLYDADASMTMYRAAGIDLQTQLYKQAQKNGHSRIALVVFNLVLDWSPLDGNGQVYTTNIVACRIKERSSKNASSSADASTIEFPLDILGLEEVDPLGNVLKLV